MTDSRTEIAERFNEYLDRYSPPRHMTTNPKAMQSEVDSLLKVVLHYAPKIDPIPWFNRLADALDASAKTRAWPTVNEVTQAARAMIDAQKNTGPTETWAPNPAKIAADAMSRGDPVGDGWLYGRSCVEMMAPGIVSHDTLRRYRSGAYFARKAQYGEASARQWEDRMIREHDSAARLGPVPDERTRAALIADERRAAELTAQATRRMGDAA